MIRAYAFNKAWIVGFLMDIVGALLMLRALSQAPVSLVCIKLALYFLLFHFELELLIISFILISFVPHVNRFLSFIVRVMHDVCSVIYFEFLIPCNRII